MQLPLYLKDAESGGKNSAHRLHQICLAFMVHLGGNFSLHKHITFTFYARTLQFCCCLFYVMFLVSNKYCSQIKRVLCIQVFTLFMNVIYIKSRLNNYLNNNQNKGQLRKHTNRIHLILFLFHDKKYTEIIYLYNTLKLNKITKDSHC